MSSRSRLRRRSLGAIVGSGIIYGAWAFFANWRVSVAHGVVSAIAQFCLSAVATSVLAISITRLIRGGRSRLRQAIAMVVPLNAMALVFAGVHALSGTPNIVATIAPSYIVGSLFCVFFTLAAVRDLRSEEAAACETRS